MKTFKCCSLAFLQMKLLKLILIFFLTIILSCTSNNTSTEKRQSSRDNIINVEDKIIDIIPELEIGRCNLDIIGEYILITDFQNTKTGLHLFDKNTFEYITSTGKIGKGPGEIVNFNSSIVVINDDKNIFHVCDYVKHVVWEFNLDSVLANNNYIPDNAATMNNSFFPGRMKGLTDSVFVGKAVEIVNNNEIKETAARYNIFTSKLEVFGYEHPDLKVPKDTRGLFGLSTSKNVMVNCYYYNDLMTICDIDGTLKYNIYGPGWKNNWDNKNKYYSSGLHVSDRLIIVPYVGEKQFNLDEYQQLEAVFPTKLLIFDIDGNYLKTLETNHDITSFCFDEKNTRIVIYFGDKLNPLAYIDLAEFIS